MESNNSSPVLPGVANSRPGPSSESDERRRFDVVMRGYERTSVDDFIRRSTDQMARLRRDLAESERRRTLAEQHATATEGENRSLRSEHVAAAPVAEEGFGYRAEKLLRLAEQEAADVRTTAAREASAVLEQARAEAEQHRHEVEQTLIARSSLLDQQATQRLVELQEREQQIGAQLAGAQAEIEAMHETAARTAEHNRRQAETEAAALRSRAGQDARRLREQAEQEVNRLAGLRDGARTEINRLAELLRNGLAERPAGASNGWTEAKARTDARTHTEANASGGTRPGEQRHATKDTEQAGAVVAAPAPGR